MKDIDFIRNFLKINLSDICDKLHISRGNVYSGKISDENLNKIRKEIENQIAKLYIKEED